MTQPTFDLTRKPWIPCETLAGARIELGLAEALIRAHELACVHDESPLATVMMYRLLLAVLHRVVDGPRSLEEWAALWAEPCFDGTRVMAYLDRWRHRFDLFDAERPFLQVPRLATLLLGERQKEAETIPVRRLGLERSGYSGAVSLLEHGGDALGLTPAEAVRGMLAFQGFGPGGRILNDSGYPKACPLRPGAVAIARGETLHRTLLLNLLVMERDRPIPGGSDDSPAWEQSAPAQRVDRAVRGWLDALTWQARRVELLPDGDGADVLVTRVVTGHGFEPGGAWREPMHALVVRDPRRAPEPVRIDPERHLWRDAAALLQAAGPAAPYRRPVVCSQLAQLIELGVLERSRLFTLDLHGLASSQAAIDLWRAERMPLPLRLLADPERLDEVRSALATADGVETALKSSLWVLASVALAPGDRSPDPEDVRQLLACLGAVPGFWAALGGRFDDFLRQLGTADDAEPALRSWQLHCRDAARRALDGAARQLGTQGRALQAGARAARRLARKLSKLVPALERKETPHD